MAADTKDRKSVKTRKSRKQRKKELGLYNSKKKRHRQPTEMVVPLTDDEKGSIREIVECWENVSQSSHFGQENEYGNIEFKWKLVRPTPERLQHLVTQMQFRLGEGDGICYYEIGVADDGMPRGLPDDELISTMETIFCMAKQIGALVSVMNIQYGKEGKVAQLQVRLASNMRTRVCDVRLCVAGHATVGKSTLIGVLTGGNLDNGRGSARMNVFTHSHEILDGRTSCVSYHMLGFDDEGDVTNYKAFRSSEWSEILKASSKVITFVDLAGHDRYLKTALSGLTGHLPDRVLLAVDVDPNTSVSTSTRGYFGVCQSLNVNVFVVVTKIDRVTQEEKQRRIDELIDMVNIGGKTRGLLVSSPSEADVAAREMEAGDCVPIFPVSCVSGDGLDALRTFLFSLTPKPVWDEYKTMPFEFGVDHIYEVNDVGFVVGGVIRSGSVCVGDRIWFGPSLEGVFQQGTIESIHVRRRNAQQAFAGQLASFHIPEIQEAKQIHRGMIVLDESQSPVACFSAQAEVDVLAASCLKIESQPIVHIDTIRQSAHIFALQPKKKLVGGESGFVSFAFCHRPEYVHEGQRIIFRNSSGTAAVGIISRVLDSADKPLVPRGVLVSGKAVRRKHSFPGVDQDSDETQSESDHEKYRTSSSEDDMKIEVVEETEENVPDGMLFPRTDHDRRSIEENPVEPREQRLTSAEYGERIREPQKEKRTRRSNASRRSRHRKKRGQSILVYSQGTIGYGSYF